MVSKRKFTDQQKARIALAAIKGDKTISQLASQFSVHPTQINRWKKLVQESLPSLFSKDQETAKKLEEKDRLIEKLYQTIGQRDFELEWQLKKVL